MEKLKQNNSGSQFSSARLYNSVDTNTNNNINYNNYT